PRSTIHHPGDIVPASLFGCSGPGVDLGVAYQCLSESRPDHELQGLGSGSNALSDSDDPPRQQGPDGESSIELLDRVRGGDREAMDRLFVRYLGPLCKWAHGRLPQWA